RPGGSSGRSGNLLHLWQHAHLDREDHGPRARQPGRDVDGRRLRRPDAEGRRERAGLPVGGSLAGALDGAALTRGEARLVGVVGAAHLRDATLGVDALPVVSRGDARSARAGGVAGAAPAEVVLRLPHALAGQRARRALGTFGAQRKIEIESARYRARRGDAFARQEVVRVAGSLRDVVDAADRARRAGVPGRARARPLATHRAAAILHDAPRAHLLGAGDVDVGEQLHVARALAGRQIERVRDRRIL